MSLFDRLRHTVQQSTQLVPAQRVPTAVHRDARLPDDLQEFVHAHAGWVVHVLPPQQRGVLRYDATATDRATAAVRAATDDERRAAGLYVMATTFDPRQLPDAHSLINSAHEVVITALARRRLPWTVAEATWLADAALRRSNDWPTQLRVLLRLPLAAAEGLSPDDRESLRPVVRQLLLRAQDRSHWWDTAEHARVQRRLHTLLGDVDDSRGERTIPSYVLSDRFGRAAREALLSHHDEAFLARLLEHLGDHGTGVTPNRRWRAATAATYTNDAAAVASCRLLLETVLQHHEELPAGLAPHEVWSGMYDFLSPTSVALLRGAVALLTPVDEPWVTPLLGDVAVHCGIGLGGSGGVSRSQPLTSSAVAALSARAGEASSAESVVGQLARVQAKVLNKTIRKAVAKALDAVATSAGMSSGELLERSVPTFGLAWDGTDARGVGDHTALLALHVDSASAKLQIRWRTPTGRVVASTPATVRTEHGEALVDLRALAAEVKKVAAAQRARLEDVLAADRTWPSDVGVTHYLAHPVVGAYARLLIWQTGGDTDDWVDGLPENVDGRWVLRDVDGTAHQLRDRLRMWHPIREPLDRIAAWRERITDAELRQPFKQAFREIYLLTPAEEETGTYSNRFAAHILRYPQAGALIRNRGWSGSHLGYWDGGWDTEVRKEIGESGWTASFFLELVEQGSDGYGTPSLCATDQVRFIRGGGDPQPLGDVPPLVFSEAMRDVDLFVGVTSVASNPNWQDVGERQRDYWTETSFGELTESAETRRDALARILPRTAIAHRCRLTERFLEVRGDLRTYKIHLGSTNILMSPADTYLCIVPHRQASDRVYLPFEEGGGKLSLILSKAFLLADDTSITDPTIVRQLRG